jgi:hypothetical protein
VPELAAGRVGQLVARAHVDLGPVEDRPELCRDLLGRTGSRLRLRPDDLQLERPRRPLHQLVPEDLRPRAECLPHLRRVDEHVPAEVEDLVDPAVEVDEAPRGPPAVTPAVLDPGDVAEPVVEEHGAAVHEVREDDLAPLAVGNRLSPGPDEPDVAQVLVQVEPAARSARERDLERLHGVVGAEDSNPELLLDQRAAGRAHRVAGIEDRARSMP